VESSPGGRPKRRMPLSILGDWRGIVARVAVAPDAAQAPGLDENGHLRSGRLKGLSMGAAIWVLSWPILIESLLNWLVGMTDTVIAAQVGVAETDAIAIAGYVMWFISLIAMSLGVGATAMVSRAVGKGRMAVANASVGQSLLLGLIGGSLVAIALAVVAGPVGDFLFAVRPGELARLSDAEQALALERGAIAAAAFGDYMRIIAMGTPLASIMFIGIACTRGAGDSIKPLWVMLIVNGVNIVASYLLSGVDLSRADAQGVEQVWLINPSPLDLGIRGVAWGTTIAHSVGALAILFVLYHGVSGVRLIGRRLRPHWHTANRLVRVAWPNFLETAGMWVGNAIVVLFVRGLGATGGSLGAHLITIRIEAVSFLPGFAMSMAAATLAGQYLGAGSRSGARRAILICMGISMAIMGMFGLMLMLIPRTLTGLISAQPEHLDMTPPLLFIIGVVQIPFAISLTLRGALRGAGDTKMVMLLTWFSTYLIRLPLVYALSGVDIPLPGWLGGGVIMHPFFDEPSLVGVWIGMSIELVFRAALFAGRFFQGGWQKVSV
jgi:putative MATE family efflux protein